MRKGLGEILLERNIINQIQLEEGLETQRTTGERLGRVLVDLGHVSEQQLAEAVAEQHGVPVIDLSRIQPDQTLINVVPRDLVERYTVMPVERHEDGGIVIAMSDPADVVARDELRSRCGVSIHPVVAVPSVIREVINNTYGALDQEEFQSAVRQVRESRVLGATEIPEAGVGLGGAGDLISLGDVTEADLAQAAPIVRMCHTLIRQAIRDRATDIHIEPGRQRVRIRYRIDGVLHETMSLPKFVQAPLVSRVKIMSEMNIAERRIPLDGSIHIRQDGKYYDLRVSTVPTIYGEKAVMRILDQTNALIGLDKLGFLAHTQAQVEELVRQPNGMVLSSGPTGHGKTTTQYSILTRLNSVEKNIITIEEPVEYQIPNVSQVSVNRRAGLTFANALRHFVRQDPDIMMIGEIRDLETAEMAIQASLTGHLVLSTLHTNDAPSAVTRLVDMGVEPFLISASVIGVLAQRLARRICLDCKAPYEPAEELLNSFGYEPETDGGVTFYRGEGCERCRHTGFRDRIGIFELMELNTEIQELIVRRAPLSDIREAARAAGMRTLREDGFDKVKLGITTPEEVARVVFTAGGGM